MQVGTNRNKVSKEEIYNQTLSTGIIFGNHTANVTNNLATIQSNFNITGLESQKKYLLGVYINSTVGNSNIRFKKFKTTKSSNGAGIKLSIFMIYD